MSDNAEAVAPADQPVSDTSEPDLSGAAPEATGEAPADQQIQKYMVKADGEDVEVDLEELKRNYQIRKHLDRKLDETNRTQRRFQDAMTAAKGDPEKVDDVLRAFGVDPDDYAVKRLSKRMELDSLSDEEKRARKSEARVAELEAREKEREDSTRTQAEQAKMTKMSADFEQRIIDSLKAGNLPTDHETAGDVARVMASHLQRYDELPTPAEAAKLVAQADQRRFTKKFATLEGESLLAAIGDDVRKKIRQAEMDAMKRKPRAGNEPQVAANEPRTKKSAKVMSEREFSAKLKDWGSGS